MRIGVIDMTNGHDHPPHWNLGKCRYCKKTLWSRDRYFEEGAYVHVTCSRLPKATLSKKQFKGYIKERKRSSLLFGKYCIRVVDTRYPGVFSFTSKKRREDYIEHFLEGQFRYKRFDK